MKDEKGGAPDRVWFSDGIKLNLGDYESADIGCGMSSDVRPGETVAQAYDRVRKEVERQVLVKARRVRSGVWNEVTRVVVEG